MNVIRKENICNKEYDFLYDLFNIIFFLSQEVLPFVITVLDRVYRALSQDDIFKIKVKNEKRKTFYNCISQYREGRMPLRWLHPFISL